MTIQTAVGPLTETNDEAPLIGSADVRYSPASLTMFDDLSRDVAALIAAAEVVKRDGDFFGDLNPNHEPAGSPEGGRFASGGGAGDDLELRPGKPMVSQSGYIRVSSRGRDDRDLELFVNPSRGTAERIAKESTAKDILLRPEYSIRAVKDDTGNLFVWKAEDGTHAEVMGSLYDSGVKDIHAQTQWWIKEGKLGSEFDSNNEESKSWIGAGQQTAKVAGGKSRKDAALDDVDDDGRWLLVTREILRDQGKK